MIPGGQFTHKRPTVSHVVCASSDCRSRLVSEGWEKCLATYLNVFGGIVRCDFAALIVFGDIIDLPPFHSR